MSSLLLLLSVSTQAQTVTNGLVAYWNFDQKNFKDSVGKFDGTENGEAPIQFVDSKAGFGQAIKLLGPADSGGADQFIEITGRDASYDPDQLAFEGGSISVSGWFTVASFDKSWQAVVAKGEGSNWRVHRRGGESSLTYAGGVGEGANDGPDISDGGWHHFVAVTDADAVNFGIALYIDGVQTAVNSSPPSMSANGKSVMIGENPDARNRYWNGLVDDIAIWNRVLKEDEIKAIFAGGQGKAISTFFTAVKDTDNDGMPDEWETKYGLNPNDPSDAAKDCNNNGVTNLDEYKAGLDPCDATKPTVVSTQGSSTFDSMRITFSESLDPAGATDVANYTISPALAVTSASYKAGAVTLATAKQTAGATYTVAMKGIKDLSKNEIAAGTTATVRAYVMGRNGALRFAYWGDANGGEAIFGTAVQGLYDDPRYPNSPDIVLPVYSFNSRDAFPNDSHENYGATIEGFITPKESGKYRFFIYTDDASELYVSTDDKESNLALVAEETGCCNNFTEPGATHDEMPRTSDPIDMVAGKKYYIRLVYKEGGGGDYGQVAWRKEGDSTPANKLKPISAEFLSSTVDLPVPPAGEPVDVKNGLVAYWNFDGSLLDSIKDFHGTGRGTNAIAYADGIAGFGKAIQLDGTDQYVEITGGNENELEFPGGSMSIGGWFKVNKFDTSWQALIAKGEGSNYRIARRGDTSNAIAYAGGVGEGADDVPNVNDGKWHHFVAVTDATGAKFGTALYVDGVLHGVNTNKAVLASNSAKLLIGENPEAKKREWNGWLDDIAIWNRVLNASEVAALYKNGQGATVGSLAGVVSPTMVQASKSGASLTIQWSPAGGTLESSKALGPTASWSSVGTANPATVPIGAGSTYYRVKK